MKLQRNFHLQETKGITIVNLSPYAHSYSIHKQKDTVP